jgi:hypothetical protein
LFTATSLYQRAGRAWIAKYAQHYLASRTIHGSRKFQHLKASALAQPYPSCISGDYLKAPGLALIGTFWFEVR